MYQGLGRGSYPSLGGKRQDQGESRRGGLMNTSLYVAPTPPLKLNLDWYRKILPQISRPSATRSTPAPSWWDADLFTGKPDWEKLLAVPAKPRSPPRSRRSSTARSRSCARMLRRLGDHATSRTTCRREVWQFLKDKGFFGMIIPKEYGGLGFSALAHSAVVHEARHALEHRGGHRDGAELARARPSC